MSAPLGKTQAELDAGFAAFQKDLRKSYYDMTGRDYDVDFGGKPSAKEIAAALLSASEILDEVRTGEEFECKCWTKAAQLRVLRSKVLGTKPAKDDLEMAEE